MSDIVEQLRRHEAMLLPEGFRVMFGVAADKITRLHTINADMLAALEEVAEACERAAHPAAPVCLSWAHVNHLNQIATKVRSTIAKARGAN